MNKLIYWTCFFLILFPVILLIKEKDPGILKNYDKKINTKENVIESNSNGPDINDYIFFKEDDFNGTMLNKNTWSYRREGAIVDSSIYLKQNANVNNGFLNLITDRYQDIFSGISISTQQKPAYRFKYGYYEIRAKLPQTKGNVAAFWMQSDGMALTHSKPNPSIDGAEIDILEYSPTNKDVLYHSIHWNGYDYSKGAKQTTVQSYIPGISNAYHTFGFEWTAKEYVVYIDHIEKARTNQIISHVPEYIILGCGTRGFGGNLNYSGQWPDTFSIDFIKMYKRKPEVRLYENCDGYGWVSDGLQAGNYTTSQLISKGFFDDATSSMEVPTGWKLTAFDKDNFMGDSIVIMSDTRCLEDFHFNDKISSLKITSN
jgi:hypothetical protein